MQIWKERKKKGTSAAAPGDMIQWGYLGRRDELESVGRSVAWSSEAFL